MGIPPLTFIFLLIMIPITLVRHAIDKGRRERKFSGTDVNNTWIGSWF
jgi:inner membrane protein involved in colicin E2 resistance